MLGFKGVHSPSYQASVKVFSLIMFSVFLFKFFVLFYMGIGILPACIPVDLRTGVTNRCELPCGFEPGSLEKAANALNC